MRMDEHIYRSEGVVQEISTVSKSFCSLYVLLKCLQRSCRLLSPLVVQHCNMATALASIKYIQMFALWQG